MDFYVIAVVLLLLLALTDLIVGVANDAVNFLNSAIGSKAAPRVLILVVASAGIFLGATFSSGMMEIARKGIFNPDSFFFSEVIILFLAVMITDIILLDLFNTYGLPTSTTVSLVFELLGAAVVISLIKISQAGEPLAAIGAYINTSSAFIIVSGIFSSVAIAFVAGGIIQYLSRLLFSFHYEKRFKYLGGLWAGLAMAFISYFLLFKGIKGASFVSKDFIAWVQDHTLQIILITFAGSALIMQLLLSLFRVNILRIVVLFGTFSLAMAFAGNDLVNFIGAPMAGFEAFKAWRASGSEADSFLMSFLKEPVQTNTWFLLAAGAVMTLTLWLSAKARTVTETEIGLSRQEEGYENFEPNAMARQIVRFFRNIIGGIQFILPRSVLLKAERSFLDSNYAQSKHDGKDKPAFDLIRASVNLTVSSILIAFATSLKLPLSTTYVTFMVAMGTSLADRAWGRGSAVYRVSGVLSVIGGWFFTAFIAFTLSGILAVFMYYLEGWAVAALVVVLGLIMWKTHGVHKTRVQSRTMQKSFEEQTHPIQTAEFIEQLAKQNAQVISHISASYQTAMSGLIEDDPQKIKSAKNNLKNIRKEVKDSKNRIFRNIQRLEENQNETSRLYLLTSHMETEMTDSIWTLVKTCESYVDNHLPPLTSSQAVALRKGATHFLGFLHNVVTALENRQFEYLDALLLERKKVFEEWENILQAQIRGIKENRYGMRNSSVFFSFQMETKNLASVVFRMVKQYKRFQDRLEGGGSEDIDLA